MARQVEWNGVNYESMAAAARAVGVDRSTMRKRLGKGWICDEDVTAAKRRHQIKRQKASGGIPAKSVEWNGVKYESIVDAARAMGITPGAMAYRLRQGYTCDEDVAVCSTRRSVTWNGITYESLVAAAEAAGVVPSVMFYRLERGYTCDDDLK